MSDDLVDAARAWQAEDPDPLTRGQIEDLLAQGDRSLLEDHFGSQLEFGTAGLRGAVGPGPNRMNRATVRRATAGLMAYLDESGTGGPVVIGRDARTGSQAFLDEAVAVVGGAGRSAVVLPEPCPTPLLAFAVLDQEAAAGIMVTASHNPPADNGYKVFLADGAQIVAPVDIEIAGKIDALGPLASVPLDPTRRRAVDAAIVDRYLSAATEPLRLPKARSIGIAYTAMHGVGGQLMLDAFAAAGFAPPAVVAAQFDPDPMFPTVDFPNPEEPGAMDLLIQAAEDAQADLALAHDPDADRLGVAVRSPDGWRRLRGDEIGVLLADHLLAHRDPSGPDVVATTVVSSRMLFRLAERRGVNGVETLTGFKWVARAAPPDRLLFGYEEALGYAVSSKVRDKDGISAALLMAEAACHLAQTGRTVLDRLDELAEEVGVHETSQIVIRADGPNGMAEFAGRLDALRVSPPVALAGMTVVGFEDLAGGDRLPPTDALVLEVEGGRVVLRPSGTEPKLKCYLEAVEPAGSDVAEARGRARARIDVLSEAVVALLG